MAEVGPSFWACGSSVSASPWLAQRRLLASATEAAHRVAAARATIRATNMVPCSCRLSVPTVTGRRAIRHNIARAWQTPLVPGATPLAPSVAPVVTIHAQAAGWGVGRRRRTIEDAAMNRRKLLNLAGALAMFSLSHPEVP